MSRRIADTNGTHVARTRRWRLRAARVPLISVLVLMAVGAGGGNGVAWADTGTAAGLQVSVSGTSSAPELVLTNASGTPCQVADTALGTTSFDQVSQQGHAIAPTQFSVTFDDSVTHYLAARLRTLAPGGSLRVPLRVVPFGSTGSALETVAWSQTVAPLGSLYPIKAGQPVQLAVAYTVPVASSGSVPICAVGAAAGAAVTLGGNAANGGSRWLWPAIGAGIAVLLLVAALVLFLLLRRRRARAAANLLLILALTIAGSIRAVVAAPPASADVSVSSDIASAWAPCASIFNGPNGDPAHIFPRLDGPNVHVRVINANGDQTHEGNFGGGQIIIFWNPNDHHQYAGTGGNADPCTSAYHEFYHAWEDAGGGQNHTECWTNGPGGPVDSGLPTNEVNATRAQNLLRQALSMPQRDYYGDTPLPTGPCQPPPQKPKPPGCTGNGCGDTNGDPHVRTYDGTRYNFQAAGEFVASRDPRGGFQIQVRQQPFTGTRSVSVDTAVALDVAGDRVELRVGEQSPTLLVNGAPSDAANSTLPRGGKVSTARATYGRYFTVTWPDGSVATIFQIGVWGLHLTAQPAVGHANHLEGLFGNFNGDNTDDVRTASGTPIAKPGFSTLYPGFADSWRITAATSLFTYAPGTSTETYTDRSFPHESVTYDHVPQLALAKQVCTAAGITDPVTLQDCELDVGLTGQPDFATADSTSQPQNSVGGTGIEAPPVTVNIPTPHSTARMYFTGTAGEKVFVDVLSTTLTGECGMLHLLGPDGRELASGCVIAGTGYIGGTVLPATGQYTVLVAPQNTDSTGSVTLQVIEDHDQNQAIVPGGPPLTAALAQPGAVARFTFTVAAGTKVFVDVSASTVPNQCDTPALLAPDGHELTHGCIIDGNGGIPSMVLSAAGTYTILLAPQDRTTGNSTVRLVVDHDQSGTISIGGPPVTATIAQSGAAARFTFAATAGQKVSIQISDSTFSDQCGVVLLEGPDGQRLTDGCSGNGSIPATTLPSTGQYALVVQLTSRDTGSLSLQLTARG